MGRSVRTWKVCSFIGEDEIEIPLLLRTWAARSAQPYRGGICQHLPVIGPFVRNAAVSMLQRVLLRVAPATYGGSGAGGACGKPPP